MTREVNLTAAARWEIEAAVRSALGYTKPAPEWLVNLLAQQMERVEAKLDRALGDQETPPPSTFEDVRVLQLHAAGLISKQTAQSMLGLPITGIKS